MKLDTGFCLILYILCLNIGFLLISHCHLFTGSKELSDKDETGSTSKIKSEDEEVHMLPRKRKGLRPKTESVPQPAATEPTITLPPVSYEKPPNPFELYLSIRKQVCTLCTVVIHIYLHPLHQIPSVAFV